MRRAGSPVRGSTQRPCLPVASGGAGLLHLRLRVHTRRTHGLHPWPPHSTLSPHGPSLRCGPSHTNSSSRPTPNAHPFATPPHQELHGAHRCAPPLPAPPGTGAAAGAGASQRGVPDGVDSPYLYLCCPSQYLINPAPSWPPNTGRLRPTARPLTARHVPHPYRIFPPPNRCVPLAPIRHRDPHGDPPGYTRHRPRVLAPWRAGRRWTPLRSWCWSSR